MSDVRQEDRHPVEIQGQYRTGTGLPRNVVVADLSTMGCKFVDRFCNLKPDEYLSIRIGNVGPLDAQVSWLDGFTVGVRFEKAIQTYVLEHMRATISGWSPSQSP